MMFFSFNGYLWFSCFCQWKIKVPMESWRRVDWGPNVFIAAKTLIWSTVIWTLDLVKIATGNITSKYWRHIKQASSLIWLGYSLHFFLLKLNFFGGETNWSFTNNSQFELVWWFICNKVLIDSFYNKVGGPEMEWALWMDLINGYEMDKTWFLNWSLQSLNESRKKALLIVRDNHSLCFSIFL